MILLAAPISGIFVAAGMASFVAWGIAGRLHPRLGQARLKTAEPLLPGPVIEVETPA
jgi:hypothetical protein